MVENIDPDYEIINVEHHKYYFEVVSDNIFIDDGISAESNKVWTDYGEELVAEIEVPVVENKTGKYSSIFQCAKDHNINHVTLHTPHCM